MPQDLLPQDSLHQPLETMTAIAPFIGPIVPRGTVALLYGQESEIPRLVSWPVDTLQRAYRLVYRHDAPPPTRRRRHPSRQGFKPRALPYFDQNPVACPWCKRPHELLSIGAITLLFTCLHLDDDADPVVVNKSISNILDDMDSPARQCGGRQACPPPNLGPCREEAQQSRPLFHSLGMSLPSMNCSCFALWHVVRDWTYFVPSLTALTTFYPDGERVYPPIPSPADLEVVVRSYVENPVPVYDESEESDNAM
uniref:Uncharacterized protein n=1 Tax=Mycena chlorophos TaxID=658473 RepID=A0ABQ0M7P5_MYCCL|nr:predicted protein [Mycena chlorophos]